MARLIAFMILLAAFLSWDFQSGFEATATLWVMASETVSEALAEAPV